MPKAAYVFTYVYAGNLVCLFIPFVSNILNLTEVSLVGGRSFRQLAILQKNVF